MAEKRFDATLLVDSEGGLSGILTDKDIAYRVVAKGLDPNTTRVSAVMTPDPSCVAQNTSAMVALRTMVTERFRHLPVADDGKVVGLLDITKCLYDAISKIEAAYEASSGRFSSTIDQLEKELSKSGSFSDGSLFETMRQKLFLPTLKTLLQDGRQVPTVGAHETCKFAAEVMFAQNTSAVMVVDDDPMNQQILGIFTSKDLTQRVIAPGLDPAQELVSQAMTSHPDCASLDTTILDALHLMHDGRYLHLPILNDAGRVVALVDVLELTYGVVNQMGSVQSEASGAQAPIWQNFWSSMLSRDDDETSSSISDQLSIDPKICPFAFKLTDLQGQIHRFSSPSSLEELRATVSHRLNGRAVVTMKYMDEEGDEVLLFTDGDLKHAVEVARAVGRKYLHLLVTSEEKASDEMSSETRLVSFSRVDPLIVNTVVVTALVVVGIGAVAWFGDFFPFAAVGGGSNSNGERGGSTAAASSSRPSAE